MNGDFLGLKNLGIGVTRVGDMGRRHAHNWRRLVPEAHLVAVADPAEQRARQVAHELEVEQALHLVDDLLARKDIGAVVIASPDQFHVQAIQAAAAAGKDILCEKPIATSLADIRLVYRAKTALRRWRLQSERSARF